MKLAFVTALPPSKVTLNEYGYHLAKQLQNHDAVDELVILSDTTAKEAKISWDNPNCNTQIKKCWKFNSWFNCISILRALRSQQVDGVLLNLQFMKFGDRKIPAALGLLLPMLCRLCKIPTVVLMHNIMEQVNLEQAGFTQYKIAQKLYSYIGTILTKFVLCADRVAVTIHKYVEILQSKYGVNNVQLIPHGTFDIPDTPVQSLPNGPLKIMAFGKFGTYKKVEILIEAIEKIRSRTALDLEIVIAGTDNPNVLGYLDSIKAKYSRVPQLTFTGYVPEEDVPKLFTESAVVVFPYTATTGSSGVLHQAGSYGKAVVMPDLGDLSNLVQDEGYLAEFFTANNVNSLATAIEKIVNNPSHRIALGKANFSAATAYPMARIAAMYIDTFEEIIAKKNSNTIQKPNLEHV